LPTIPQATATFYRQQQRIADVAGRAVLHLWRGMSVDDIDGSWARIQPDTTRALRAGMAAAVTSAIAYTPALLAETGTVAKPAGLLVPEAFTGLATDGVPADELLAAAPIRAKQAIAAGAAPSIALQQASAWVSGKLLTALADTRREVVAADLAQRPTLTGYIRMLNPPSCKRCVVLAGKWFRWNAGFERHPQCDCVHIPSRSEAWAQAEGFISDPYEYFKSLSPAEQDRLLGKVDAQAVRDGADIYRVVNIRERGLAVSKQALRYGTPTRMMVNAIYELGLSREATIRVLAEEGYITGPQLGGGNVVGRYREAYLRPISRPLVPGSKRERVLRARETGVRDPLDRATMTAQERRLFDAVYRREYAIKYGYLPRTIGQNSADLYSGLVGLPATRERIALLDAQISKYLSKVTPKQASMLRLVDELGLRSDEFASRQVFDRIEHTVGVGALERARAAAAGGGGRIPPRRGSGAGFGDPPDPHDGPAWKAYWRSRQDALSTNRVDDELQPHEIEFYEGFIAAGNQVRLISRGEFTPRVGRAATSDFEWVNHPFTDVPPGSAVLVEAKSFEDPNVYNVAKKIRETVRSSSKHGPAKDTFIIYGRRDAQPPEGLLDELSEYNRQNSWAAIKRLLWWDGDRYTEIPLT